MFLCASDGEYSKTVLLSSSVNPVAELVVSQTVKGTQYLEMRILNLAVPCGDPQLVMCTVSGTGSSTAPYQISDIQCLQKMELGKSCHYKQIANIDAAETATWNAGAGWLPVGLFGNAFTGTYNGQGYKISNLSINYTGGSFYEVGLFGYTQ